MARSSPSGRTSPSQRALATPMPCSALIVPPHAAASASTASSTVSSSGSRPSTLTWTLPSPRWPKRTTRASGARPRPPRAPRRRTRPGAEGHADVELVRDAGRADGLGVALAQPPQPLALGARVRDHGVLDPDLAEGLGELLGGVRARGAFEQHVGLGPRKGGVVAAVVVEHELQAVVEEELRGLQRGQARAQRREGGRGLVERAEGDEDGDARREQRHEPPADPRDDSEGPSLPTSSAVRS